MNFETVALEHAEACAFEGAYFYEGSMFFDANTPAHAVDEFRIYHPNTMVSRLGNEMVVDFVDYEYL